MSLYPITTIDEPNEMGHYQMLHGHALAFPLELEAGQSVQIIAVHIAPVQDHSIRMWVSAEVNGPSLGKLATPTDFWHPNRVPNEIITVYDAAIETPPEGYSIALAPGSYFVNALNLINSRNALSFRLTIPE